MDKYGVVIVDDHLKVASKKAPCPDCGSHEVDYSGITPMCKNCGTRPWEKKVDGKRR